MMMPSHQQTGFTYGICSYYRPGTAYVLLRELLGDELFKKTLKEYINRWNGKHPTPYDFFYTFNDVAKQDLAWFWKPWFFEIGVPDLAIKMADKTGKVVIERKGALPIPINVELILEDGTKEYAYESAAIWKDGKTEFTINKKTSKKVKSVKLGSNYTPDSDLSNNKFEVK
jgi:aminopeptidase N